MTTRHLTARVDEEVVRRLDARSEQTSARRSELMQRYLDLGMRMEEHPGIVFRDGPAGIRAGLAAGPDVCEIVRVIRNVDATGEAAVDETADWTGLSRVRVDVAVGYYAAWPDEIDRWIERIDAEARKAQEDWERRRDALA